MTRNKPRSNEPRIVITDASGVQHVITGRVARMVMWLCDNEEKIEYIPRGRLDVGFSGEYQEWHLTETLAGY